MHRFPIKLFAILVCVIPFFSLGACSLDAREGQLSCAENACPRDMICYLGDFKCYSTHYDFDANKPLPKNTDGVDTQDSADDQVSDSNVHYADTEEESSKADTSETDSSQAAPKLELSAAVYAEEEAVIVGYSNLPENGPHGIGIFVAHAPNHKPLEMFTIDESTSGVRSFEGLRAGDYDVRLFLNASIEPQDEVSFSVVIRSTNTAALCCDGNGVDTPVKQLVLIEPQTTYDLAVDLYIAQDSQGKLIFDTNDKFDSVCQKILSPSGSWSRFTCSFYSHNYSRLTVRFYAVGDNFSGTACLDNISIKERSTDLNLVANGDFENGTEGWEVPSDDYYLSSDDLPPEL